MYQHCSSSNLRMCLFRSKNAAARRTGAEDALDVRNMRRLVQALPQYRWGTAYWQCYGECSSDAHMLSSHSPTLKQLWASLAMGCSILHSVTKRSSLSSTSQEGYCLHSVYTS